MKIKSLTVSEINNYIKKSLDNDFILKNLSVKGEISNLKYHSSGHTYFSLKDKDSKINCIMFKDNADEIDFKLEDGMNILAKARCSIYKATGSIQLYIESVQKEGLGELYIKFEELKKKLDVQGYFDFENKRKIPSIIDRVGIITSETGAVIQDIINVSRQRNNLVDMVLYPAKVQGDKAYKTIIDGIRYFNIKKSVDAIIIARGGGSIEELWNFNEEELAKEIFKSKIPIISAIGHETDYTICDFTSDLRASTPSHAAEILVPKKSDILKDIDNQKRKIDNILLNKIDHEKNKIKSYKKRLLLSNPKVDISNSYILIDRIKDDIEKLIKNRVEKEKMKIKFLNDILLANNPVNILNKGYSIVYDKDKNIISSKEKLNSLDDISISFSDGEVLAKIISTD